MGGVPEQPLDFVDGGGDVFDVRVFQPLLGVAGHASEQTRQRGVDHGGEVLEPFAGGSAPGTVEPVSVFGQVLGGLFPGLVRPDRELVDLQVVDEHLPDVVDIGQRAGDGPPVNLW